MDNKTKALSAYTKFLLDAEDFISIPTGSLLAEIAGPEDTRLQFDLLVSMLTAQILGTILPPIFAPAFEAENPYLEVKGYIRMLTEEEILPTWTDATSNAVASIILQNSDKIGEILSSLEEIAEIDTEDPEGVWEEIPDSLKTALLWASGKAAEMAKGILSDLPIPLSPASPHLIMGLQIHSSAAVGIQTALLLAFKDTSWSQQKEAAISKFITLLISDSLSRLMAPLIGNMDISQLNQKIDRIAHGVKRYAEVLRKAISIMEDLHDLEGIDWEEMPQAFDEVIARLKLEGDY